MVEQIEDEGFDGRAFLSYVEELIKNPKEHPREVRVWDGAEIARILYF